jgi:hypothetical protein
MEDSHRGMGLSGLDMIDLAQDTGRCRALVNKAIDFRVP